MGYEKTQANRKGFGKIGGNFPRLIAANEILLPKIQRKNCLFSRD